MTNAVAQVHGTVETLSASLRRLDHLIRFVALPFVSRGVQLDDLMQVGRIALMNAHAAWRQEASLWTYARPSVLRDMIRYIASEADDPSRPTSDGEIADFFSDVDKTPEEALEISECVAVLCGEMINLTPEERRVLRARFVDDSDVRSIAADVGLSKSEVDRTYHRAISKLRERLQVQL